MRWFSILLLVAIPLLPVSAQLTAGAARVDITPKVGTPMAGYYYARGAEGTLDPLTASALVLEQDGQKVALVTLDLITTTMGMVREARKQITDLTKIPGENVMISATHSHTGPVLVEGRPRDEVMTGKNPLASEYIRELPAKLAQLVKQADAARQPAKISQAIGREDNLAFVRRFHMTDGSVGWNPGKKNPKVLRPTAPTDPSLPLVLVESLKGEPIAAYLNFAMHSDTVGGLYFSADYAYHLRQALAAAKGEKLITLFTLGCCGDVNHINVNSPLSQKGPGEAARIGIRLAAEALRTWEKLEPLAPGSWHISREMLDLPLAPAQPGQLEQAREVVAQVRAGAKPTPPFLKQVEAFRVLDVTERLGKPLQVEVQTITLGPDLAFVSLPGEIFVELGLSIKSGSPFKNTIVAELANGSIGYVPTRTAYAQGNYEVISARCAIGSGELLVDSALKQLRSNFVAK